MFMYVYFICSELWNGVRCGTIGAVEHFGVDEVEKFLLQPICVIHSFDRHTKYPS